MRNDSSSKLVIKLACTCVAAVLCTIDHIVRKSLVNILDSILARAELFVGVHWIHEHSRKSLGVPQNPCLLLKIMYRNKVHGYDDLMLIAKHGDMPVHWCEGSTFLTASKENVK